MPKNNKSKNKILINSITMPKSSKDKPSRLPVDETKKIKILDLKLNK
ncbi:hypothetical protein GMB70_10815 [Turicibacter sanguinis]|nr:hypothetical protein [Turicibacter sanguinis]